MSTITGAQAICQSLPPVHGTGPGSYSIVKSSGHSTTNATPPRIIIAFPENTFQKCLTSPALVQALEANLNVVDTEPGHSLATEGDIERAAAVYLLHDINIIIGKSLLHPLGLSDKFSCLGQATISTSRPDIKFVVDKKTVLILEYKRVNALREEDWTKKALIKSKSNAREALKGIKAGDRTALLDNAGVISQQASKYSSQCGLVVLCDYKSMIVIDFTPGNIPFNDETNPVQFLWSSGNSLTHKQLLTAALIYGMRKAKVMGPNV